jgi:hypothetical protein
MRGINRLKQWMRGKLFPRNKQQMRVKNIEPTKDRQCRRGFRQGHFERKIKWLDRKDKKIWLNDRKRKKVLINTSIDEA